MIILATLLSIQSGIPWTWLPGTTNAGGLVIEVVLEPTELTVEGGRECVCVWHIKLTTMISSELSFAYIRSSKSTSKMRSEVRQDMSAGYFMVCGLCPFSSMASQSWQLSH